MGQQQQQQIQKEQPQQQQQQPQQQQQQQKQQQQIEEEYEVCISERQDCEVQKKRCENKHEDRQQLKQTLKKVDEGHAITASFSVILSGEERRAIEGSVSAGEKMSKLC